MFNQMKIKSKLFLSFGIVVFIALVIGVIGIQKVNKLAREDKNMYDNCVVALGVTDKISTNFQRIRVNFRDLALSDNEESYTLYTARVDELNKSME